MNRLLKLLCAQLRVSILGCILLSGLLIFSGCTPMVSESALTEKNVTPLQANESVETDSFASPEYQQKPAYSIEQSQQRLQEIEALIHTGDNIAAKHRADAINPLDLSSEQQPLLNLLNAQILLGLGDPEMASRWLAAILPDQLDVEHKIEYFQSQAFAYSLTGNALDSAKSRIALNELLTSPKERDENQAAIIESLMRLSDAELESYPFSASDPLAGWMALALLMKSKSQPGFNDRLAQWRANFPGHPGNSSALEISQETAADNSLKPPASIALLLPESGTYAQAAKAIRAGFMAAYNEPGNNGYRPSIHVYNSDQGAPLFLYNQAIADGADFIIGPLQKETIQNLADSVTFQVPVLALNHIPGLEKNNLYQFGLSPIDDVLALTIQAWQDGHRKAAVFVPDNAQGHRIAGYFEKSWQDLGGNIVESETFKPKETDFSVTIKKLLNLDESEYRYNKIEQLIPGLKYQPRRRQDIDAVLLNANSFEGRSINPQLHYYQSNPLPVYATASIYSGQSNASLDADLNTIIFCDTPWLLDNSYMGSLSRDAIKETLGSYPDSYLRLVAMGIDTHHLITRIQTLETSSYAGATGKLSLVDDNRIQRELTCAKFIDGQAKPMIPINAPIDTFENNPPAPEPDGAVQNSQDQPQLEHAAE
jgi:outer membrane PBP1 activator LpoA protein